MAEHIERALGRIEAKLDLALAATRDQDARITTLEHVHTRIVAFATMAGAFGSAVWAVGTQLWGRST